MLKILIPIILFFTIIQANNVSSIITEIKNAKPSEKRILINKLKVMLRNENIQTRKQVFNKLRKSQNKRNNKVFNNNKNFNNNKSFNSKTHNSTNISSMKAVKRKNNIPKPNNKHINIPKF